MNRWSKSSRAGLKFPVSRISKKLRTEARAERVSSDAPVFLAAVVEYMVREMVEISGNEAARAKKKRITPSLMRAAVHEDAEFSELLRDCTFSESAHPESKGDGKVVSVEKPKKKEKTAKPKKEKATKPRGMWQYRDGDGWKDYDLQASAVVEDAYQTFLGDPDNWDVRAVKSGTWMYQVDFGAMQQKNVQHESHKVRDIRRI